jgi:acetyl-CoA carboxylase biotin carboxylase subunit
MYHPPAGNGIRLDTFIYSGYKVPHYYDNLLAKLIVTGRTRNHAIKRALRALNEMIIDGIETNIELHKKILSSKTLKKEQFLLSGSKIISLLYKLLCTVVYPNIIKRMF